MAKIDVNTIDGYEKMTAEEKVAALEAYEVEAKPKDNTEEINRYKTALSKSNSEAAEYKRKWKDTLSEQEKKDAERAEADKIRDEELASYKAKERIAGYANKLMTIGYDAETANSMAKELPDGITDTFFNIQKQHIESQKQAIENELIKKQTNLTPGRTVSGNEIEEARMAAIRKAAGLK